MSLLPLQKGILYGPINSRRLGKSLGINLMPVRYKLCSFNCVYCHYGCTDVHTVDLSKHQRDLPMIDDVLKEIEGALKSSLKFDYITFSGNGEPTLYPWFNKLVEELVKLRDRHRSGVKVALLSNSTGLINEMVKACINKIDLPVFKLDAGTIATFRSINRPAPGVVFEDMLNFLSTLKDIYIQTVLVQGSPSNVDSEMLDAYFKVIRKIQPKEVHIYSIDRPVPNENIVRVLPEELEEIARHGKKVTGVDIKAFYSC